MILKLLILVLLFGLSWPEWSGQGDEPTKRSQAHTAFDSADAAHEAAGSDIDDLLNALDFLEYVIGYIEDNDPEYDLAGAYLIFDGYTTKHGQLGSDHDEETEAMIDGLGIVGDGDNDLPDETEAGIDYDVAKGMFNSVDGTCQTIEDAAEDDAKDVWEFAWNLWDEVTDDEQ